MPKNQKQDPRVIRTRRDLIRSMCDLLKEKRYNKITVRDITDRAMINRATFYAHFEDKYKLLEEMLLLQVVEKLKANNVIDGRITSENLRRLTLTICEFLVEFHAEHVPPDQHQITPVEWQVMDFLYKFLLEGSQVDSGSPSDSEPEAVARMTSSVILGSALRWTQGRRDVPAEKIADQVVNFIMFGLGDLNTNTADKLS
ncbi:MAG: TetR/AcrR family transcriptional regulator [Chloroflexota bacterium]